MKRVPLDAVFYHFTRRWCRRGLRFTISSRINELPIELAQLLSGCHRRRIRAIMAQLILSGFDSVFFKERMLRAKMSLKFVLQDIEAVRIRGEKVFIHGYCSRIESAGHPEVKLGDHSK